MIPRVVALSLALALLLGAVSPASAAPARAPAPLAITPTSGPPGTLVHYAGSGFTPNGHVSVLLVPGFGIVVDEVVADPSGNISGSFAMPSPGAELNFGPVGVFAIDETTRQESPATTFTLTQASVTGTSWFFAEGSTQPPFDTWFLVQNPTTIAAHVTFTFQLQGGGTITRGFVVGPTSRFSVFANQVIPGVAFSTRIDSDQPIRAERAMYVGFDGDAVTGIAAPSRTWLFAEGSTQPPFQTWLLIQNPNSVAASATITYFLLGGGSPATQTLSLPPQSRTSVFVNQVLPNVAFSTRIDSDQPVVAERAVYRFPGNAATAKAGLNAPSTTFFFPDAKTSLQTVRQARVPFDSFLLLQNPNSTPTTANVTLFRSNGTTFTFSQFLPASSRQTIFLNQIVPNGEFGIRVDASQPIIAERSMFFGREPRGAMATPGSTELATSWFLAEGSTQPPFIEDLFVLNPNASAMSGQVEFQLPGGQTVVRGFVIGPRRSLILHVNSIIPGSPVSARITTNAPSAVERQMFFNKLGSLGGTDALATR